MLEPKHVAILTMQYIPKPDLRMPQQKTGAAPKSGPRTLAKVGERCSLDYQLPLAQSRLPLASGAWLGVNAVSALDGTVPVE